MWISKKKHNMILDEEIERTRQAYRYSDEKRKELESVRKELENLKVKIEADKTNTFYQQRRQIQECLHGIIIQTDKPDELKILVELWATMWKPEFLPPALYFPTSQPFLNSYIQPFLNSYIQPFLNSYSQLSPFVARGV